MISFRAPRQAVKDTDNIQIGEDRQPPLTLLFFGETGVGKSTLINTFANFLEYPSFEEASVNELKYAIPCSFTITDAKHEVVDIVIGQKAPKKTGKSDTQTVKSYFFDVSLGGELRKLRIIDTPGFGDTEGVLRDKENFQKVIEHIKKIDNISAICILLKPNETRLHLQFRYCFKELLAQLNKESTPNICFCYTNARSTNFRPGEAFPLLKQNIEEIERDEKVEIPLDKNNIFCFDSEVFRYLAAKRQQNIKFEAREVKSFQESWDKGYDTLFRLIAHSANLSPTSVKPIYVLSQSRKLLSDLSKPMTEILQNIELNKQILVDKNNELELTVERKSHAEGLYIERVELKPIDLDQPNTVCRNLGCARVVDQVVLYSTCHEACSLQGLKADVIGLASLKSCHIFNYGKLDNCTKCGHHWMEHMQVTSDYEETLIQEYDSNVQTVIDQNSEKQIQIQNEINHAACLVECYEEQQRELINDCAKLASYIKRSGIMFFNPELDEYMNLLIREEEQNKKPGIADSFVLECLRTARQNFKAEVLILEESLKKSNEIVTERELLKLIKHMSKKKYLTKIKSPKIEFF